MDTDYSKHNSSFSSGKKSSISVGVALCIWVVVFIILLIILRAIGIRWFSTIVFSSIVAAFVLCFIFPLKFSHGKYMHKSEDGIFGLIIVITWILLIVYIIWKVFTDYDQNRSGHSWWGNSGKSSSYGYNTVSNMGSIPKVKTPSAPAGPF